MVSAPNVTADTCPVEETDLDAVREDLEALEAEEARVSAERSRLHRQIDSGFATESARAREREVSDARRELHRRIDSLQDLLGIERTSVVLARRRAAALRELESETELERPEFLTAD
jgi:hypothetical protein